MERNISAIRLERGLRHALGDEVCAFLNEESVLDLLLNEDGRLWINRIGMGRVDTGSVMTPSAADYALRMLASHAGVVITHEHPLLNATLPTTGERVAGTIAPVTERPTFAIRKPPRKTFKRKEFGFNLRGAVAQNDSWNQLPVHAESDDQANDIIDGAVALRKNVMIVGATGSGKTSLLSAFLEEQRIMASRCLVIEDTAEIKIAAPDHVRMMESDNASLRQLVAHSLRYKPDRLIIGECRRGDVAIELLNALNSGHPGSFFTIHADSASQGLRKFSLLCLQGCQDPQTEAIKNAIGCVIFCRSGPTGKPEIGEVMRVV